MDEVIASTETSVRDEKESLTIVSSDEDNDIKNGKNIPKNISTPSEDESDVITAHVVIEQALHLPYIKENQNKRLVKYELLACLLDIFLRWTNSIYLIILVFNLMCTLPANPNQT